MKIESYGISNVGMKRFQNEDSYLINDNLHLYVVADGMGGHLGGEQASRMAVSTVEEILQKVRFDPEVTQIKGITTSDANPGTQLRHAIQVACQRIYQQALYDERLRGMGTTTVAALLEGKRLFLANVGDSRAYLLRQGKIKQLTEDHSLVREQVKAGMITADAAKRHKMKNIITRSVGYQEDVDVDIGEYDIKGGDRYLLCSDGLSNLVEDVEIEGILLKSEPRDACETLVKTANSRGGDDNITVIIMQVDEIN